MMAVLMMMMIMAVVLIMIMMMVAMVVMIIIVIMTDTFLLVLEPSSSSVSKWAIMDVLHSSHKFHHVTLQQVEHSLDRLLQSSDVYRQSEHEYCLV